MSKVSNTTWTKSVKNEIAKDTPYYYYTNARASNDVTVCGVNCTCSRNKKYATENSIPGYKYIKHLGSGGFGTVNLYQCNQTRVPVAIKEVSYNIDGDNIYHEVATEYNIVMGIKHPNITRYYDLFLNENRYKVYIVMEYAKRGSLRQLLNDQIKKGVLFQQNTVLRMIHDLILGVQALNSHHVVHCDLKPENILIGDDGTLKICDFGTAHFVYDIDAPLAYTLAYLAPERLEGIRPDEKTEVWSIGVIFYEMCTLNHPFAPFESNQEMKRKIVRGLFTPINCRNSEYSNEMQNLLESMMQKHRVNRQSLASLLNHKLLRSIK